MKGFCILRVAEQCGEHNIKIRVHTLSNYILLTQASEVWTKNTCIYTCSIWIMHQVNLKKCISCSIHQACVQLLIQHTYWEHLDKGGQHSKDGQKKIYIELSVSLCLNLLLLVLFFCFVVTILQNNAENFIRKK
jgi:hypothetical protein